MHIEARILGRKTNQLDNTIWRALSEKREGSLGNLSFLTLSRFLLILFGFFFCLFFFSFFSFFFIFSFFEPPCHPLWWLHHGSQRGLHGLILFFSFLLSSLYFVWLCKCFFDAILFFFQSFANFSEAAVPLSLPPPLFVVIPW